MRAMVTEINKTVLNQMFNEEYQRYQPLEKAYFQILETPFPTRDDFPKVYEDLKKKEKEVEQALGESQLKLNEIYHRKMVTEAAKDSSISFSASRKKVFRSRR